MSLARQLMGNMDGLGIKSWQNKFGNSNEVEIRIYNQEDCFNFTLNLLVIFEPFLVAGLISELAEINNMKWLQLVPPFVGGFSLILLVLSGSMPGILILMGSPGIARAWQRGVNPIAVSATSWDQLSNGQRFLTYLWSIGISGLTLLAITGLIIQAFRK